MSLFVRSDKMKNGGDGITKKKSSLADKIGMFSNKTNVASKTFNQVNKLLNNTNKTTTTTTTNIKKFNNNDQSESSTTHMNNKSSVYNNANGKTMDVKTRLIPAKTNPNIIPNKNATSSITTTSSTTTTKVNNTLNTTKRKDSENGVGLNNKPNQHNSNVSNGNSNIATNSVDNSVKKNAKINALMHCEEKNAHVDVIEIKPLHSEKTFETFSSAKQGSKVYITKQPNNAFEKNDFEAMDKNDNRDENNKIPNNKNENNKTMMANGLKSFDNSTPFKTTKKSSETKEKTATTNNITTTTKVTKTETTTIEKNLQNQNSSTTRISHSSLSNSISQSHSNSNYDFKNTSKSCSNDPKLDNNLNQTPTSTLISTQSASPANVGCVSSRELLARFSPVSGHEISKEAFTSDHKSNSILKNNVHFDINHKSQSLTNEHASPNQHHNAINETEKKNKDVKVIMCDSKKFHAVSVFKAAVVDEASEPQTTTVSHKVAGVNPTTETAGRVTGSNVAGSSVTNSNVAGRSEDDDVLKFAVFEAQDLMDELQTLKDIFSIFGAQDGCAVLCDDANEDVVVIEDTITTIDAQIKLTKQS